MARWHVWNGRFSNPWSDGDDESDNKVVVDNHDNNDDDDGGNDDEMTDKGKDTVMVMIIF